jgi:putative FmdB family regulatory protein
MFSNEIGEEEMPVYEYECQECNKVFEVQQKIADKALSDCPECHGPVKKLMSMSSFQLKGGGWYADGYSSSANGSASKTVESAKPATPAAPCQTGGGCAGCPAAAPAATTSA